MLPDNNSQTGRRIPHFVDLWIFVVALYNLPNGSLADPTVAPTAIPTLLPVVPPTSSPSPAPSTGSPTATPTTAQPSTSPTLSDCSVLGARGRVPGCGEVPDPLSVVSVLFLVDESGSTDDTSKRILIRQLSSQIAAMLQDNVENADILNYLVEVVHFSAGARVMVPATTAQTQEVRDYAREADAPSLSWRTAPSSDCGTPPRASCLPGTALGLALNSTRDRVAGSLLDASPTRLLIIVSDGLSSESCSAVDGNASLGQLPPESNCVSQAARRWHAAGWGVRVIGLIAADDRGPCPVGSPTRARRNHFATNAPTPTPVIRLEPPTNATMAVLRSLTNPPDAGVFEPNCYGPGVGGWSDSASPGNPAFSQCHVPRPLPFDANRDGEAVPVTLGVPLTLTTAGFRDSVVGRGPGANQTGPDRVLAVEVATPGVYTFDTCQSPLHTSLSLYYFDLSLPIVECHGCGYCGEQAVFTANLTRTGRYVVVVEGYGAPGEFTVTVRPNATHAVAAISIPDPVGLVCVVGACSGTEQQCSGNSTLRAVRGVAEQEWVWTAVSKIRTEVFQQAVAFRTTTTTTTLSTSTVSSTTISSSTVSTTTATTSTVTTTTVTTLPPTSAPTAAPSAAPSNVPTRAPSLSVGVHLFPGGAFDGAWEALYGAGRYVLHPGRNASGAAVSLIGTGVVRGGGAVDAVNDATNSVVVDPGFEAEVCSHNFHVGCVHLEEGRYTSAALAARGVAPSSISSLVVVQCGEGGTCAPTSPPTSAPVIAPTSHSPVDAPTTSTRQIEATLAPVAGISPNGRKTFWYYVPSDVKAALAAAVASGTAALVMEPTIEALLKFNADRCLTRNVVLNHIFNHSASVVPTTLRTRRSLQNWHGVDVAVSLGESDPTIGLTTLRDVLIDGTARPVEYRGNSSYGAVYYVSAVLTPGENAGSRSGSTDYELVLFIVGFLVASLLVLLCVCCCSRGDEAADEDEDEDVVKSVVTEDDTFEEPDWSLTRDEEFVTELKGRLDSMSDDNGEALHRMSRRSSIGSADLRTPEPSPLKSPPRRVRRNTISPLKVHGGHDLDNDIDASEDECQRPTVEARKKSSLEFTTKLREQLDDVQELNNAAIRKGRRRRSGVSFSSDGGSPFDERSFFSPSNPPRSPDTLNASLPPRYSSAVRRDSPTRSPQHSLGRESGTDLGRQTPNILEWLEEHGLLDDDAAAPTTAPHPPAEALLSAARPTTRRGNRPPSVPDHPDTAVGPAPQSHDALPNIDTAPHNQVPMESIQDGPAACEPEPAPEPAEANEGSQRAEEDWNPPNEAARRDILAQKRHHRHRLNTSSP